MNPDFLVIGAGVAGLRSAIELAPYGRVLVIAKDRLDESSSAYAQGGIAAALNDDDDIELHEQDTMAAGDGLCDPAAVHVLVEEAPAAIGELIHWGAKFDRDGSKLLFAREGAHSRSRVLHAQGDSTGREIARTLYEKARTLPAIEFRSFAAAVDLLPGGGITLFDGHSRTLLNVPARSVLLATGGLGRVFLETTNPDVASGDGVAIAYRAGAQISDLEFVQFHPTALHVEGAPRFLLSEALRGEGGVLRNGTGERFMSKYDARAELAPRDVVSRSILEEMRTTGDPHMWLDLTHLDPGHVRTRFPRIHQTCILYGIDIAAERIPVHPAAHYAMGGVRTDLDGRTSLPGLFAAGEAACTGVHGANRLASNSLLEGLVFGARAARAMIAFTGRPECRAAIPEFPLVHEIALRRLAWNCCGILRDAARLLAATAWLRGTRFTSESDDYELRSMHTVIELIARCALARRESRGGHYRLDYPEKSVKYQKHSIVRQGSDVCFG